MHEIIEKYVKDLILNDSLDNCLPKRDNKLSFAKGIIEKACTLDEYKTITDKGE